MADEKDIDMEDMENEMVIVMTDEEGNEHYYSEDMIIPIDDKKFAILVSLDESDCECGDDECDCDCAGESFIARIETNADGEDVYVDPTDEEFELVRAEYERIVAAEEEE